MKLHHLLSTVAACGLLAGVAHAQTSASDPSATPSAPASDPAATSSMPAGSMPSSSGDASGMAVNPTPSAQTTGATTTTSTTTTDTSASAAGTYGQPASVTVSTTTNGPVPDTAENRAKYGGPMSHAGKHSAAKGN